MSKNPDSLSPRGKNAQRGNVFTILMGGVALTGALGYMFYQTMSGPIASMSRVTHATANQMETMSLSRALFTYTVTQGATSGDCDSDGSIEPPVWRDGGAAGTVPLNGGWLPDDMASSTTDPWGTEYGYCTWDTGTENDPETDGGCGAPVNRLEGAANPNSSSIAPGLRAVFAIISAGPDRKFGTVCRDFTDADADSGAGASPADEMIYKDSTNAASADDLILRFTYREAEIAAGDLWRLKTGDPGVAEINKDLEVAGRVTVNNPSVTATALVATGMIDAGGGVQVGTPDTCNLANKGVLRYAPGSSENDCDLDSLALGEKCPEDDVVYAGMSGGNRLFTTMADLGTASWNNGSASWTDTATTSASDGLANTDALVALADAGAPYDAAQACRALGAEWYLPSKDELNLLYTNNDEGVLAGTFYTTASDWYWSSTENLDEESWLQRFSDGFQDGYPKDNVFRVRCVRQGTGTLTASGYATPAVEQVSPTATADAVSTIDATFSAPPTAGNTVIVSIAGWHSSTAVDVTSVTDNQGGTYTLAEEGHGACTHADAAGSYIYYRSNVTTGTPFTVTVGLAGASNVTVTAMEVSGLEDGGLDQSGNTGPAGNASSSSVTTGAGASTDGTYLGVAHLAPCSTLTNANIVQQSGWTQDAVHNNDSTGVLFSLAHKILTLDSADDVTHQWTHTASGASGNSAATMATFRAAASSADVTDRGIEFCDGTAWQPAGSVEAGGGDLPFTDIDSMDDGVTEYARNVVGIGKGSLEDDGSGTNNTGVGQDALAANVSGSDNTALGYRAIVARVNGSDNTAAGYNALAGAGAGSGNTALGHSALLALTTGSYNTAMGMGAGENVTTAGGNTAFGYLALDNSGGDGSTAFGAHALESNTTGLNTAFGYKTLQGNTTGTRNTAFGYEALMGNDTGDDNTGFGYQALKSVTLTPCDLDALAVGEKCEDYDLVYVGMTGSDRMFTTMADSGQAPWNNGTTNYTVTGATSDTDGLANTDLLVALADAGAPYEAANICRDMGAEWYLPAKEELDTLYDARNTGDLSGTFNTSGVWYRSSSENTSGFVDIRQFDGGGNSGPNALKDDGNIYVRCVRTGSGVYGGAEGSGSRNTAMGYQALTGNLSGDDNAAAGYQALSGNTTGSRNTAAGYQALSSNTTGSDNTAAGYQALFTNTTGSDNTAAGYQALFSNTTGSSNTAFGEGALYTNTTTSFNTAAGARALYYNTATANTAVGTEAMYNNDSGEGNTGVGRQVMYYNDTGSYNTAIASHRVDWLNPTALYYNLTGSYNTALGSGVMVVPEDISYTTAIGPRSLPGISESSATENVAVGAEALRTLVGGARNTAVGYQAGECLDIGSGTCVLGTYYDDGDYGNENVYGGTNSGERSAGDGNTGLGNFSCNARGGDYNVCLGSSAGYEIGDTSTADGNYNTGIGYTAPGRVVGGDYLTALGSTSMRGWAAPSGFSNATAIGKYALGDDIDPGSTAIGRGTILGGGENNTGIGDNVMSNGDGGDNNTAMGYWALHQRQAGTQYNTAFGYRAVFQQWGYASSVGNTGVGTLALEWAGSDSDYNTAIGYLAKPNDSTQSNMTVIGYFASAWNFAGANSIRIGNGSMTSIGGEVAWTPPSDRRKKKDISDSDLGLDFIMSLRPVSYRMKDGNGRLDYGFIAQEVEQALEGRVANMVVHNAEDDSYLFRPDDLLAPLVRAVQERQRRIENQQRDIEALRVQIEAAEAALGIAAE